MSALQRNLEYLVGKQPHELTQVDLLRICMWSSVQQVNWTNRDTAHAQMQLGECYALIKAGCEFIVALGHRGMMLDVDVAYHGFNWFEDSHDGQRSFYIPTAERLIQLDGKDWYC